MARQIHATCVELDGIGVLLRGPSGSGKSDLALRLIDRGARLVADDRVVIAVETGALIASAPPQLSGMLEVRGLGLVRLPNVASTRLGLIVDLVAAEVITRLPETETCRLLGVSLPRRQLDAGAASACAKLRLAVEAVTHDILVEP